MGAFKFIYLMIVFANVTGVLAYLSLNSMGWQKPSKDQIIFYGVLSVFIGIGLGMAEYHYELDRCLSSTDFNFMSWALLTFLTIILTFLPFYITCKYRLNKQL